MCYSCGIFVIIILYFLQKEDAEFKQCENFALSNILHHTYLSVNRHEVQRSIKGLINKFSIHGFTEKAKRLEILVERFVNSKQFKDHDEVSFQTYFIY